MIKIDFSNLMSLFLYRSYTRSTVTTVHYSCHWYIHCSESNSSYIPWIWFTPIQVIQDNSRGVWDSTCVSTTLKRECALNLRGKNTNLFFLSTFRCTMKRRNATHASHYYKFRVKAGITDELYKTMVAYLKVKKNLYIYRKKSANLWLVHHISLATMSIFDTFDMSNDRPDMCIFKK